MTDSKECCSGCSERVFLSNDITRSFVSSITFMKRQLCECQRIILSMTCEKADDSGKCYAEIRFFRNNQYFKSEHELAYEITNKEKRELKFEFVPDITADKAEVKVFCSGGASLDIEKISVDKI